MEGFCKFEEISISSGLEEKELSEDCRCSYKGAGILRRGQAWTQECRARWGEDMDGRY